MKKLDITKIYATLRALKETYAQLLEDKHYMLSTCEFDRAEDEFEFDCICDDLKETEEAIDKLYDVIYHEDNIVVDDVIYYTNDDDVIEYDIFS